MKKLFTLSVLMSGLFMLLVTTPTVIAQPTCQAGFQYSIGNTTPNGTMVSFYDSSFANGTIVAWSWSFGNGLGSTQQNPVTQFLPGTYAVCLTITSVFQNTTCNSTYCDSLVIPGSPLPCNPSFTFTTGALGTQFTSAGGTTNTSWFWDFGDGNTSTSANPLHVYANPGNYNVCLVVSNNNGITCTGCQTVIIQGTSNCNASFTWAPDSSGAIQFTNTSTGNPGYYSWNFGNNQTSNQQNPVYTFNGPGTYLVCLTIYDSLQSCFSTFCDSVTVQGTGTGCSASFGYQAAPAGVFFSANMQNNVAWVWDFGDGTSGTGANVSHNYSPGSYTVCLTVATANGNTCTSCQTITVQNTIGCSSNFALYPDTVIAHNYFLVNLATGAAPLSYLWSWGDGTSSTGAYPSHTYASGGLYTICLTITDANGCTSTTCYPFQLLRMELSAVPVTINVIPGTTSVQELNSPISLNIYPNPASGKATAGFTITSATEVSTSLINVAGQVVKSTGPVTFSAGSHQINIDLSDVSKGIYFLELTAHGQKTFAKIAVQ